MQSLDVTLDKLRGGVRKPIRALARVLNRMSDGKLSPNVITLISFLAHIPIAWLIATQHNLWAALLLIIFGLFDTLDGELARLQNRTSSIGMLLDSITDKMKEVFLYIGISYVFVYHHHLAAAVWATAALGASLLVSYVNAWGEAAMSHRSSEHQVNKTFRSGLLSFDLRMALLVIGLLTNHLILAVVLIAILATFTVFQRCYRLAGALHD